MVSTAPARKDPTGRNEERITFLRIVVPPLALALGMSIPVEFLLVTRDHGKTRSCRRVRGPGPWDDGLHDGGWCCRPPPASPGPPRGMPRRSPRRTALRRRPAALARRATLVKVNLVLEDVTVEVAPGIKYAAWAWAGGAPGPVIHARQGHTLKMTLTNDGAIPHSVDFHAARVAPDKAFIDVFPGKSFTFRFKPDDPGVFMYHCGTKPVLMHLANGMYGAIVVEPKNTRRPHADKQYVLVASEWYLESQRSHAACSGSSREDAGLDDVQRLRRAVRDRFR